MNNNFKSREWITPITTGAFFLSAMTGILLFFRVNLGLVRPVHEWLSWLFVIGGVLHMIVNRKVLMAYISKPVGKSVLFIFFLLICLSLLAPDNTGHSLSLAKVNDAIIEAPLSDVARLTNHNPEEAMNLLKSKGMTIEDKDQSIREIAVKNHEHPFRILDVIFS